jgi:hypothetical protein
MFPANENITLALEITSAITECLKGLWDFVDVVASDRGVERHTKRFGKRLDGEIGSSLLVI